MGFTSLYRFRMFGGDGATAMEAKKAIFTLFTSADALRVNGAEVTNVMANEAYTNEMARKYQLLAVGEPGDVTISLRFKAEARAEHPLCHAMEWPSGCRRRVR
ncbi:MAG: hypothetical protein ACI4O9_00350 [Akkermansia sp.]